MIRAETQTDLVRVNDGAQGPSGNDASIEVSKVGDTATITATSGDGTVTTATVSDGSIEDFEIGAKNLFRYSELVPFDGYPFIDTEKWNTYLDNNFMPSVGQWCRYGGEIGGSRHKEGDWATIKIGFIQYVPPIELEDEPLLG